MNDVTARQRCEIESGGSDEDSQDEKGLSILKGTLDVLELRKYKTRDQERKDARTCVSWLSRTKATRVKMNIMTADCPPNRGKANERSGRVVMSAVNKLAMCVVRIYRRGEACIQSICTWTFLQIVALCLATSASSFLLSSNSAPEYTKVDPGCHAQSATLF